MNTQSITMKFVNQSSVQEVYTRHICGALHDLVPFVQFEKREKHPWRSINFSKVAGFACNFTNINTPPWVFFTFFKLYKW